MEMMKWRAAVAFGLVDLAAPTQATGVLVRATVKKNFRMSRIS
jgi:hypothetical protein